MYTVSMSRLESYACFVLLLSRLVLYLLYGDLNMLRFFCLFSSASSFCSFSNGRSYKPLRMYRKEGNVLFNDTLNTFYLRLYGVRHMVKDHSDSEKGNPLPPHRLLFPISSKGSFICTIPQTG